MLRSVAALYSVKNGSFYWSKVLSFFYSPIIPKKSAGRHPRGNIIVCCLQHTHTIALWTATSTSSTRPNGVVALPPWMLHALWLLWATALQLLEAWSLGVCPTCSGLCLGLGLGHSGCNSSCGNSAASVTVALVIAVASGFCTMYVIVLHRKVVHLTPGSICVLRTSTQPFRCILTELNSISIYVHVQNFIVRILQPWFLRSVH